MQLHIRTIFCAFVIGSLLNITHIHAMNADQLENELIANLKAKKYGRLNQLIMDIDKSSPAHKTKAMDHVAGDRAKNSARIFHDHDMLPMFNDYGLSIYKKNKTLFFSKQGIPTDKPDEIATLDSDKEEEQRLEKEKQEKIKQEELEKQKKEEEKQKARKEREPYIIFSPKTFKNDTMVDNAYKSDYKEYLRYKVGKILQENLTKEQSYSFLSNINFSSIIIDGKSFDTQSLNLPFDEVQSCPLFTMLVTYNLYDLANKLLDNEFFKVDSSSQGDLFWAVYTNNAAGLSMISDIRKERIKVLASHGINVGTLEATVGNEDNIEAIKEPEIKVLLEKKYPEKLYFDVNGKAVSKNLVVKEKKTEILTFAQALNAIA